MIVLLLALLVLLLLGKSYCKPEECGKSERSIESCEVDAAVVLPNVDENADSVDDDTVVEEID